MTSTSATPAGRLGPAGAPHRRLLIALLLLPACGGGQATAPSDSGGAPDAASRDTIPFEAGTPDAASPDVATPDVAADRAADSTKTDVAAETARPDAPLVPDVGGDGGADGDGGGDGPAAGPDVPPDKPAGCPSGQIPCGGACVDPLADAKNCGGCGMACPAPTDGIPACVAGSCAPLCGAGRHACAYACADDADPATCGSSCAPCYAPLNATPTCAAGQCSFACTTGYHSCSDGSFACHRDDDPANCGSMCAQCPAAPGGIPACASGQCALACYPGDHLCAGQCVSDTNPETCGTSCDPCPAAPAHADAACDGKSCGFACRSGYAPSCGGCVDLGTDLANCGACGAACAGACSGGTCTASGVVFSDGFAGGGTKWSLGDWHWKVTSSALSGSWGGDFVTGCGIRSVAWITAPFAFSATQAATVSFDSVGQACEKDELAVVVSADAGSTWVVIASVPNNAAPAVTMSVQIPADYLGERILIGFQLSNGCPDTCGATWTIDNVQVQVSAP